MEQHTRNLIDRLKPWLFILLILFLGANVIFFRGGRMYEWVFVYYMSYDNDLSGFGETILMDLKKGVANSKIAVVVQADFADSKGMRRIALYEAYGRPKRKETFLKSENSADPAELREYFRWIQERWKARNYCIVFLDHGGRLNSMCLDKKPSTNQYGNKRSGSEEWLPAAEAGVIVADFNKKVDGKVRLLFLQQCGRATIQNLYSFLDAAEHIMASPLIVGAPNTYYTKTLASLAHDPNITGEILARTIMQEDEHYTLYTLISNNELKKLPEKLTHVLESLEPKSNLNQPQSCPHIFKYEDEKFYDLKSYLQALSSANNDIATEELDSFFNWCDEHLIVSKAIRGPAPLAESHYSGLSIYVPSSREEIGRYDFLPLHQQTSFKHIMKLMFSGGITNTSN
jgi:hypothetical protein